MTQQRRHFFLELDDDVRLTQIFGQASVLSAKFLDFFFHRVALGLRPAFLWGQSLENSLGPLSPPVGQQRRVQTFAAEKGAKTTARRRSDFSFLQDALFVLSGVSPPLRFGNYFRIRPRSRHRRGARFGWRRHSLAVA